MSRPLSARLGPLDRGSTRRSAQPQRPSSVCRARGCRHPEVPPRVDERADKRATQKPSASVTATRIRFPSAVTGVSVSPCRPRGQPCKMVGMDPKAQDTNTWLSRFLSADFAVNQGKSEGSRAPFAPRGRRWVPALEPPETPLIERVLFKTITREHPALGSWRAAIVSEATGARRGAGKYHLMLVIREPLEICAVYDICTASVALGVDAHDQTCIECAGLGWEHWFGVNLGAEWGPIVALEHLKRPSTPTYPLGSRQKRMTRPHLVSLLFCLPIAFCASCAPRDCASADATSSDVTTQEAIHALGRSRRRETHQHRAGQREQLDTPTPLCTRQAAAWRSPQAQVRSRSSQPSTHGTRSVTSRCLTHAYDGSERLFVVERFGSIKVFDHGQRSSRPAPSSTSPR